EHESDSEPQSLSPSQISLPPPLQYQSNSDPEPMSSAMHTSQKHMCTPTFRTNGPLYAPTGLRVLEWLALPPAYLDDPDLVDKSSGLVTARLVSPALTDMFGNLANLDAQVHALYQLLRAQAQVLVASIAFLILTWLPCITIHVVPDFASLLPCQVNEMDTRELR
ncbi:hypothetical protein C7212DRAFT_348967, partial [Tuber magnatum]